MVAPAAMPAPRRVARKSVSLLMELGLSKGAAARVVQLVCDEATGVIYRRDPGLDVTWLACISTEAALMARHSGETAAQAVAAYQEGVARWARDFDRGHSAQQLPAQH